jgi:hypothetical protein
MRPKISWYKVLSGMTQDTKLAVVARRAGFRRGEVLAVWMTLLDCASLASPRGNVRGIDPEEIAATLECDTAAVASVMDALREKKMILPDGRLAGWDKNEGTSTPRTRAWRARQKEKVSA